MVWEQVLSEPWAGVQGRVEFALIIFSKHFTGPGHTVAKAHVSVTLDSLGTAGNLSSQGVLFPGWEGTYVSV